MRYTKEKIYELIPAIYRQRDAELGKPLEALINIIAEQCEIVQDDIEVLGDNWFIETCSQWLIHYIGDLVGAKTLHAGSVNTTINQRAFVANTIAYRRRKGTLFVLEQLARDLTGWNTKAVEFFKLLDRTQHLNSLRLTNLHTVDLRNVESLELLDSPFNSISHTLEVRNIATREGRYNIQNIGLFPWRLQAYPVFDAPAYKQDKGRYFFSPVGYDMPLFNHPETEEGITHITEEINVPAPIRRINLNKHLANYYGERNEKSIRIQVNEITVGIDKIIICNLAEWKFVPPSGKVAVDPVLGRIAFPEDEDPIKVRVTYYYGFSSELGAGPHQEDEEKEEEASDTEIENMEKIPISKKDNNNEIDTIAKAIEKWTSLPLERTSAIFEIQDSDVYEEAIQDLSLPPGVTLKLTTKQGEMPVLRMTNSLLKIKGEQNAATSQGSNLILEGLLIDKTTLEIQDGQLDSLIISHCTLVPGDNTSLKVNSGGNFNLVITLKHTIAGNIDSEGSDTELRINDSIIDNKKKKDVAAVSSYKVSIDRSTIFGKVDTVLLNLVSDSIFTDIVVAKRRQQGCIRFSYIPDGSQTPPRYKCQPEFPSGISELAKIAIASRMYLHFTSGKYGHPGYAQLHINTSKEISEGASDGNEMGAFNHLKQSYRLSSLKASLDEYLRFGLEAGIIPVT